MQLLELIDYLEKIAPSKYQMSYDNSGLLVGDINKEISNVLISLDCIEEIVDEAIERDCNVIVAHHPIIFSGLKRLTGANYIERTVIKAIKNDIAIYAIHTNLDSVLHNGVNSEICNRLGLKNRSILQPDLSHDSEHKSVGAGMLGTLSTPMKSEEFLEHLKSTMQVGVVKHTKITSDYISTVAVCGGSGGFLLSSAKAAGADVFVTSDYKYHEFFDADGDLIIADIGHYESEQFTIDLLHRIINEKFSTFAALKTGLISNPVRYI